MISGINTDIRYNGKTYHIQTEDGGSQSPVITTHLFQGGAIQSTRKTSYRDILKSESLKEIVREMMADQHKTIIRDLMAGKIGRPEAPPSQPSAPGPAAPSLDQRKKKSLDDLILDYLSKKEDG